MVSVRMSECVSRGEVYNIIMHRDIIFFVLTISIPVRFFMTGGARSPMMTK